MAPANLAHVPSDKQDENAVTAPALAPEAMVNPDRLIMYVEIAR